MISPLKAESKMDLGFLLNKDTDVANGYSLSCMLCMKSFPRKFDLQRHLQNTHGTAKQCTLCKRKLKSANRQDMRIRHLTFGCQPFKQYHSQHGIEQSIQQLAKAKADALFI